MKIERIDLWHIKSPLVRPYPLSKVYGTLTHAQAVVLRLTCAGGLEGWGEADPQPPFTEEWPDGVMLYLSELAAPRLLGRDALDRAMLSAELDAVSAGNPTAKGAVDMALHDLAGKHAGVPVSQLLGGALRDRIPALWPLGSGTLEESLEVVEEKRAEGFRTFMVKTGSRDVAEDAARCLALIERYHPEIRFIADANQGWSEAEAVRFAELIGAAPLDLLEQPVARANLEGMKRVREAALCPVSADESVFTPGEAAKLAAACAVDVFSIKPSKNAGLAPSRKIASLAEGHGLDVLMNSMIEFGITQAASLQLGITLPNLMDCGHAYMSTLRIKEDPTDFSALVRDGTAHAPAAPGLGVAVDPDHLARLCVSHATIGSEGWKEGAA